MWGVLCSSVETEERLIIHAKSKFVGVVRNEDTLYGVVRGPVGCRTGNIKNTVRFSE